MKKILGIIGLISVLSGALFVAVKVIELECALKEIGEAIKETDFSGISL